jgi:hypothetical protein
MSKAGHGAEKLSFSQKMSRLRDRLKSAEWRRYGLLLVAGKALGIAALFAMITIGTPLVRSAWDWSHTVAYAQQPAASTPLAGTTPATTTAPPDP